MKTNCQRFVEDIAAYAVDNAELSPDAAEHVQSCESCRQKLAEFKAIAALHRSVADNIAEPKRRLGRRHLEESLAIGGRARSNFEIRWRPILAGAAALALLFVAVVLIYRMPPQRWDARNQQSTLGQPERNLQEEAFEQSLSALRHDVEDGRERMLARNSGAAMRPYRLKDVEIELRN